MSRILYGVVGEGLGHATRSKVVITYLLSRGHQVLVASSGRAATLLADSGFTVVPVTGLTLSYLDGAVDFSGTLAANLVALSGVLSTGSVAWAEFDRFAPDIDFADFDALVSLYG